MPSETYTKIKAAYIKVVDEYMDSELQKQRNKVENPEALSHEDKLAQLANEERKTQLTAVDTYIKSFKNENDKDAQKLLVFVSALANSIQEGMFIGHSSLKEKLQGFVNEHMPEKNVDKAKLVGNFISVLTAHPERLDEWFKDNKAIKNGFSNELKTLYKELAKAAISDKFKDLDDALAPKAKVSDHSMMGATKPEVKPDLIDEATKPNVQTI